MSGLGLQFEGAVVIHAIVRTYPRVVTHAAGLALLALSLVAIPASDAFAQSTAPQKAAEKSAQAPGPVDTVIVSKTCLSA